MMEFITISYNLRRVSEYQASHGNKPDGEAVAMAEADEEADEEANGNDNDEQDKDEMIQNLELNDTNEKNDEVAVDTSTKPAPRRSGRRRN